MSMKWFALGTRNTTIALLLVYHFFSAQVLQTVTEENESAIRELCSCPAHLSQLESLLNAELTKPGYNSAQLLLIRTCIAGDDRI